MIWSSTTDRLTTTIATTEWRGIEIVDGILDNLMAYTKGHLQREESLMASLQFPQLAQHKVYHDRFTSGAATRKSSIF